MPSTRTSSSALASNCVGATPRGHSFYRGAPSLREAVDRVVLSVASVVSRLGLLARHLPGDGLAEVAHTLRGLTLDGAHFCGLELCPDPSAVMQNAHQRVRHHMSSKSDHGKTDQQRAAEGAIQRELEILEGPQETLEMTARYERAQETPEDLARYTAYTAGGGEDSAEGEPGRSGRARSDVEHAGAQVGPTATDVPGPAGETGLPTRTIKVKSTGTQLGVSAELIRVFRRRAGELAHILAAEPDPINLDSVVYALNNPLWQLLGGLNTDNDVLDLGGRIRGVNAALSKHNCPLRLTSWGNEKNVRSLASCGVVAGSGGAADGVARNLAALASTLALSSKHSFSLTLNNDILGLACCAAPEWAKHLAAAKRIVQVLCSEFDRGDGSALRENTKKANNVTKLYCRIAGDGSKFADALVKVVAELQRTRMQYHSYDYAKLAIVVGSVSKLRTNSDFDSDSAFRGLVEGLKIRRI